MLQARPCRAYELLPSCVHRISCQKTQPLPATHLVSYRAEISGAPLVSATKTGLQLASIMEVDGDAMDPIHRIWIPLPIVAYSLPHFLRVCDTKAYGGQVIDLTQDDKDEEVIDLTLSE